MSDELRRTMQSAVGQEAAPDVADIWRQGRRRRTAGRRWRAAGTVAAVLLLVGIGLQLVRTDGTQVVRTSSSSEMCTPPPYAGGGHTRSIAPDPLASPGPPRTLAAMVHGGGSELLTAPDVVARVDVERVDQLPEAAIDSPIVNPSGEPQPGERRAQVVVTDPVTGIELGARLTISDLDGGRRAAVAAKVERALQQAIAEHQSEVDQIDRPLAELDAQIAELPPDDPRYAALIGQREQVREAGDGARIEAQNRLSDLQMQLHVLQISERILPNGGAGTPCHQFQEGDDLVVALTRQRGTDRYELTGSSSFFLVDGDGFSAELDLARRSVDGWSDSDLLDLARESTPEEFVDRLRQAAAK